MKNINSFFLFIFCYLFFYQIGLGQSGNSPYTIFGLGKTLDQGNTRNKGMGGVGVALGASTLSNNLNPALLTYNKLTQFEASYFMERKELSSGSDIQRDLGGNVDYFSFAFPISARWTIGLGLRPLTSVNYQISLTERLAGTPNIVDYTYSGTGGISQAHFSHGINVTKNLSLGFSLNYNFGIIERESQSRVNGNFARYAVNLLERKNYSQLNYQLGLLYSTKVSDKTYANIGATFTPNAEFSVRYLEEIQRLAGGFPVAQDTLLFTDLSTNLPSRLSVGIGLERLGKFAVGFDYTTQAWGSFTEITGNSPLVNTTTWSLGGEITPDFTSVENYLKRVTYRAGLKFEQQPWQVQGGQLTDVSVSAGFSLPMARGFSNINFATTYGRLSADLEGLIEERYVKFHLGLTINDQWFVRRQIN